MKNQKIFKTPEAKKSAQRGQVSGRKPKKATHKLGAHHTFVEDEEETKGKR